MPDWLDDLLLESIAPPPVWLPSGSERLADAQVTLQRRFGLRSEASTRPSHHLQDTILYGAGFRSAGFRPAVGSPGRPSRCRRDR